MGQRKKPEPALPPPTGKQECPACHRQVYVSQTTGRFAMHFQEIGLAICRKAGEPAG